MSSLQQIDGVIILGLALMAVAVASALRGLYVRANIPFLLGNKADAAAAQNKLPAPVPEKPSPRKAA
jgi:hypothetical protein